MQNLFDPTTTSPAVSDSSEPWPPSPKASPSARKLAEAASLDHNKLRSEDYPVHDWYRFVLSYPPHLVRTYLDKFELDSTQRVLDPFCGTGTTVVECKKQAIPGIGIEANPMASLASRVKLDWAVDPAALRANARAVADAARQRLAADGIADQPVFVDQQPRDGLHMLPPSRMKLLLANSISPLPLHKTLVLLEALAEHADPRLLDAYRVALAKAVVGTSSNLHFGPEVGVGKPRLDAPVVEPWLACVRTMADDLAGVRDRAHVDGGCRHGDARQMRELVAPRSIDAVITSPPYPNEKDYSRTTRLESVLLGLMSSRDELRSVKKGLVRSNTRGVYRDDDDDQWIASQPKILALAQAIEKRRLEMGKTSGFERTYHRVTRLYFGGMAKHFEALKTVLRPGARLAYVVGDQASYLRVMIRTGQLLADIADSLGYEVESIDLFRTRLATATRAQLNEEVVVLRWPGK